MTDNSLYALRFPIGKFQKPDSISGDILTGWIVDIDLFPARLQETVEPLSGEQMATPYRPGGWTIHQLVHHCADSHMNAITRVKLALTEDQPTIKPYLEDRWAELPDVTHTPVSVSLQLLEALHFRWTALLKSLTADDWARTFVHPEHGTQTRLDASTGMYAWHCNHHLAHVTNAIARNGW